LEDEKQREAHLNLATVPEMADDRSIEPPTMQGSTPTAVVGATSTSARSIEIDQYGVKRQQEALGIGDLEADAGARW
jgi:hypothetical protein